jgi:hypothetical protein
VGPVGGTVVVVVVVVLVGGLVVVVVGGLVVVVVVGGIVVVVLRVGLGTGGVLAEDVATGGLLSTSSRAPRGRVGVLRLDGVKGVNATPSPPFV